MKCDDTVALVEDDATERAAFQAILASHPRVRCVECYASATAAIATIPHRRRESF